MTKPKQVRRKPGRPKDPKLPLDDPRREMFSKCVAAGQTQRDAVINAGFAVAGASVTGSRLIREPYVSQRVHYLRDLADSVAAESVALTKSEILRKLSEISTLAIKTGDLSAANRALELIGKQLGMFVERKVIGIQALIAELTPDNLRLAKPDELLRLVDSVDSALLALPASTGESTD